MRKHVDLEKKDALIIWSYKSRVRSAHPSHRPTKTPSYRFDSYARGSSEYLCCDKASGEGGSDWGTEFPQ